jgi:octaprenyl-diphosphate synthase
VLQLTVTRDVSIGEETYIRVVRGKTAALFSAATEAGAVLAGAEPRVVEGLRTYGDALGIAFQIVDDLLDWEGGAEIGKNRGDDFREGKVTLPIIRTLERAGEAERAFWARTVGRGEVREGDLEEAGALLRQSGALAAARAEAEGWAMRAREALRVLPDDPLRDLLDDLAGYVVTRAT